MAGFDASEAALLAAGKQLSDVASETRTGLSTLHAQASGLLDGGWTGGAARGFSAGWNEWNAALGQALTALDEMSALLGVTGHGYKGAEQASQATVLASGPQE